MKRPRSAAGAVCRPAARRLAQLARAAIVVLVCWSTSGRAPGQTGELAALPKVRRILVPVEHLSEFLAQGTGRWHVMDAAEFHRRMAAAERRTPLEHAPRLSTAEYRAEFTGDAFAAGTVAAEIAAPGETSGLLWLDPTNLALADLSWKDDPAVWGTDSHGRSAMLVDESRRRLDGAWSLSGRRLPASVEFDLRIPRATVSRFVLSVPATHAVRASGGEAVVSGPEPGPRSGWNVWRVDAGSRTEVRLSVARIAVSETPRPVAFAQVDVSYVLRPDGLQFQCDFDLEVAGGELGSLRFALPSAAEILSVEYRSDGLLPWAASVRDGARLVDVALPDPVLGPARTIRIRGFAPPRLGRKWMLPRPRLIGAPDYDLLFLGGRSTLVVDRPLEVRSLSAPGARQIGAESEGQTFTFQRFRSTDPQTQAMDGLIVEADYPEPAVSARTLTAVLIDPDNWTARTRIDWRATAGSTFAARCGIPAGWQVAEVRSAGNSPRSAVTGWDVVPQEDGSSELQLEFRDALVPENPLDNPGKSVVVLAQRLPPPAAEPFAVPAVRPLDCDVTESVIAVSHPGTAGLRLRGAARTAVVRPETLPEPLRNSTFWQDVASRAGEATWLRAAGLPDGRLSFPAARNPAHVRARTDVALEDGALVERFALRVAPHGQPVERLLVHLAAGDGDVSWRLDPPASAPLDVVALPPDQREDWDLPPGGVLHEVRLPAAYDEEFVLVGGQSRPLARANLLALPFVPGAMSFQGTVALDASAREAVELEADGPASEQRDPAERAASALDPRSASRRQYLRPTAAIRAVRRLRGGETSGWAAVSLHTRLSPDATTFDDHRAVFHIPPETGDGLFSFELPPAAELTAVLVNQVKHAPSFDVPLEPGRRNVVAVDYRTRSGEGLAARTHAIDTPRSSLSVLAFEWTISLPPGTSCAAEPELVALGSKLPEPGWTERMFGPLGRPSGAPFFNPFLASSWRGLFAGARDDAPPAAGGAAPAGWSTIEASAPFLPPRLVLRTRDESRIRLIGWTALLAASLAGLTLRLLGLPRRMPLATLALSAALAAAWAAPAAWAPVTGGLFAGCLLSALVPLGLFRRVGPRPEADHVTTGSTATYQHVPAVVVLSSVVWIASSTAAQETVAPMAAPAIAETAQRAAEHAVLVPVGKDGQPAEDLAVVYVTEALRERLGRVLEGGAASPRYLIARADYRATVEERDAVTVDARYEVVLLPGIAEAAVELPLAGANPGGPDACRVDGEPAPVVPLPGGRSFTVAVSRPEGLDQPRRVRIGLALHPPGQRTPGFDVEIPSVAASRLELRFTGALPAVVVPAARGRVSIDAAARTVTADLGGADRLQATWSAGRETSPAAAAVPTGVLCDVDVRPTWIESRYRVSYRVPDGQVDYLAWNVPRNMILRKASIDGAAISAAQAPRAEGDAQVLLTLPAARGGEFAVDATFIAPAVEEAGGIPLAPGHFLPPATDRGATPVLYRVGVRTAPEFRLVPGERDAAAAAIAPESFLTEGAAAAGMNRPQFAYDLHGPAVLRFALEPLVPLRRVRQFQGGRFGRDDLAWKLRADVETTGAPAFRHVLLVDPRLRIRSVSVEEAQVERLVRWSRDGERLNLFLDRGTTATQRVVVTGDRPLEFAAETTLPDMRFEDAELVESRIELVRDPGVSAELRGAALERLDAVDALPEIAAPGDVAIGKFVRPDFAQPVRVRALLNERPRVDTLTVLGGGARGSDGLELAMTLMLPPPAEGAAPYRLRIPAALAAGHRVASTGCHVGPPAERPDGALEAAIEPQPEDAAAMSVTVTGTVRAPLGETWILPQLEIVDWTPGEHYLFLSLETGWVPEETAETVRDAAPEWVAARPPEALPEQPMLFRAPGLPWKLSRVDSGEPPGPVEVAAVWTRIWQRGGEREFGTSVAELPLRQQGRLEWRWPAECELRAAFVDGAPVALERPVGDLLVLPVEAGARTVALFWARAAEPGPAVMRSVSPSYPAPREVPAEKSYLSIVSDGEVHLLPRAGLVAESVPQPALAPVPEELRAEPRAESFSPIGDPSIAGRLPAAASAPPVSFWAIRRSAAAGTAAAAIFLLVAALSWRPLPALAAWLAAHPSAAWALVGCVWWWWLDPGIVGLALVAASILHAVRRRRLAMREREMIVAS
ncbi:MAG: hypothetical protein WD069_07545 [Planctomycetales bacterium]